MSTLERSKAYDAKLHPHQLGDRTAERINSPTPHQASLAIQQLLSCFKLDTSSACSAACMHLSAAAYSPIITCSSIFWQSCTVPLTTSIRLAADHANVSYNRKCCLCRHPSGSGLASAHVPGVTAAEVAALLVSDPAAATMQQQRQQRWQHGGSASALMSTWACQRCSCCWSQTLCGDMQLM
jgi:hypothetical protein